jgi:hypothetical protein
MFSCRKRCQSRDLIDSLWTIESDEIRSNRMAQSQAIGEFFFLNMKYAVNTEPRNSWNDRRNTEISFPEAKRVPWTDLLWQFWSFNDSYLFMQILLY